MAKKTVILNAVSQDTALELLRAIDARMLVLGKLSAKCLEEVQLEAVSKIKDTIGDLDFFREEVQGAINAG